MLGSHLFKTELRGEGIALDPDFILSTRCRN